MEIDIVYLWVNGNDPQWREKRNSFTKENYSDEGMNSEARYSDNGELKYSLRSIEKYAPWIRNIFIVTDNQTPEWLDLNHPKVRIVDHTEILPSEALPTFNSTVIEHALFRIPGLSEYLIYANDDMFLNRETSPADFFAPDGLPYIRFNRRLFRKLWLFIYSKILKKNISHYNRTIQNSARLVEGKYGKYIGHKIHHNIDAYRKSDLKHAYEVFAKDIEPTLLNHTRNDNDIQRNIYSYVPAVENRGHVKFVTNKTSFRCHIEHPHQFAELEKCSPMFFCINDSQFANEESHKLLKEFLEKKFPEKSQFEK